MKHMKTFTTPLILIGSVALLSGITIRTSAQDLLAETAATELPACLNGQDTWNTPVLPFSTDFVDARFIAVPYNGDAYLRMATRLCSGGFIVRVLDANGTVRMTGAYVDAQLTVANGSFTYFHDNGAIESLGTYMNGTKSGTWERYSFDGERLADREYPGLDVDRLLELNGLVAYARTLK